MDLLQNPAFRDDKLDLAQHEAFDAISGRNDDVGGIAARESNKLAYGAQSPYARVPEYQTIPAINREDLMNWYQTYVQPNDMIVGVSGDFVVTAMEAKLRAAFSALPKGPAFKETDIPIQPAKPGYYLVPKTDVNQSAVRMVAPGTRR